MLNFNSILLFSEDPKALAAFYKKVLGSDPIMEMESYSTFQAGDGYITIGPHDKVKGKNSNGERIMINLETDDVKGEFDRIKSAGAHVIAEPYTMEGDDSGGLIATLSDPDGNIFQLMTPWNPEDMKN
jgi:predicted enzyme related to lactoylglutathione lyase